MVQNRPEGISQISSSKLGCKACLLGCSESARGFWDLAAPAFDAGRQPEEAALFWPTLWWIAKDLFWLYELFAPAMIAAVFVYVFLTYACVTVKEGRRAGCSSESARGELGET